jgi:hypothetical protein
MSNAAPEWQAKGLGRRRREVMGACPLEGLVRRELCKATRTISIIVKTFKGLFAEGLNVNPTLIKANY